MGSAKTPYQRIIDASKENRGVRLSAEEVDEMATDEAITLRALRDEEADECAQQRHGELPTMPRRKGRIWCDHRYTWPGGRTCLQVGRTTLEHLCHPCTYRFDHQCGRHKGAPESACQLCP